MLTQPEEYRLIRLAQKGDRDAVDQLIRAHRGFLHQIASRAKPIDFDDAHQEAVIALMIAIRKFRLKNGRTVRLLTFFCHVWRTQFGLLRCNDRTVRIPSCIVKEKYKALARRRTFSIDAPDDDDKTCAETLEADHDVIASACRNEQVLAIRSAIDQLPERMRLVIRGHVDGLTLVEIGQQIGVCRERARQLRETAIDRLRRKIPVV
jgi:RNA polymerase sigma factor (sigma-70 family)